MVFIDARFNTAARYGSCNAVRAQHNGSGWRRDKLLFVSFKRLRHGTREATLRALYPLAC